MMLSRKAVSGQTARTAAVPARSAVAGARVAAPAVLAPVRSVAPAMPVSAPLRVAGRTAAVASTSSPASATQEKTSKPMNIVFVATEVAPWSKTGGLGDVVGGLPIELAKRGHSVISIAPRYDQYVDGWDTSVVVNVDGEDVRFFHAYKKGVHRVFVDHPWFLAKVWGKTGSKLYGPKSGADFVDNHKRFALFNKAAIEAVKVLPFGPGEDCVFVANDWHSSLLPVILKDVYQKQGQFKATKCALCIHNIAFQGRMWEETFSDLGLPAESKAKFAFSDGYSKVFTEDDPLDEDDKLMPTGKSYSKVNWLKAGIMAADKVLTVSPNYATEIQSGPAKGVEMDKYLKAKGVEGIVNGMDTEEWNPATDKLLTIKYDQTNVHAGKAAAKEQLQAECGLPIDPSAPMFGFIGRLEEQKGIDILLAALPKFLKANPKAQFVLLGTGKASLEKQVASLDKQFAGQYKGIVKFSAPLAHIITAGVDFFMVPSRFEPCGLIQLHAMQYGTVPIAASTGGLVDTVLEGVTGFHIGELDADDLLAEDADAIAATMERAVQVYPTPMYKQMVTNCISQDLSWAKPARKWEGILEMLKMGITAPGSSTKAASVTVPVKTPIPGDKKPSPIVAAIKASEAGSGPKPAIRPLGLVSSTTTPAKGPAGAAGGPKKAVTPAPAAPKTAGKSPIQAPINPAIARKQASSGSAAGVSKAPTKK